MARTMPPYQGGGDMVDIVTFEKTTYMYYHLNSKQVQQII